MLNIKKAITVSKILPNNFVSLSLIIMFCCLGNLYAQMPGDFPEGKQFDLSVEEEQVLFADDFNDGDADGWWLGFSHDPRNLPPNPYVYGNWRVEEGELAQDIGGDHFIALIEDMIFSNQVIETRVKINPTVGYAGITVWYHDVNNWVNIFIYPYHGEIYVYPNVEGSGYKSPFLDDVAYGYPYATSCDTWYNLKIEVDSDSGSLTVYVDDVKIFTHVVSPKYREGLSGLNCGNYGAYFDDVKVVGEADTTPPSAITDLVTSSPTPDSITLTWTAPGDDGDFGLASQYDIRYSTSPIDEGNWASATQAVGEPAPNPPGTAEIFIVTGLSPDTTYYFAMKTADEVPNWSDLSNVAFGSKLSLNDIVGVNGTDDDGLSLRDDYGLSSTKLKVVPDGWTFRIINDIPIPADGYTWWQVREEKYETSPINGWVVENWLTKVSPENLVPPDVPDYFSSNQDKIEAAITWAISQEGKTDWAGWCLKFVANAFGRENSGYQNPNEMKEALGDEFYSWTKCWNLPRGALIFFSALGDYVEEGHIGIYLGDQGVVHSYDKVRVDKEDSDVNKGIVIVENLDLIDSYIGWAYPPKDWIDNTSPSAIADLATSNPTPDSITLTWTAPGDDEDVGLASQYDIRYSTSPIDEGNWDSATQAAGEPAPSPAGTKETFTVTGLSADTTYYFAMKTADDMQNWSELSNVVSATTLSEFPPLLAQYEPILYLYGGELGEETYMPMNVDAFVEQCSLWEKGASEPVLGVGEVTLEKLGGYGDNYYLKFVQDLDPFNTPDPKKAQARYESIPNTKVTYYSRITSDGDYTVLQYWFFYAFNYWGEVEGGLNNHEGDWEMIMIFLKGDAPEYVAYSSHHNEGAVARRIWSQIEKKGEHPIVYAALGSHANYFTLGEILVKNPVFIDHTSGDGRHIGPGESIEWHHGSDIVLDDGNLPGWVDSYAGMWGVDYKLWDIKEPPLQEPPSAEISVPFPTDGPVGPKFSDDGRKWNTPVKWAGIPDEVSITIDSFTNPVPQGGTLEISALLKNNSSKDYGRVQVKVDVLGLIDIGKPKLVNLGAFESVPMEFLRTMPIAATLGIYTAVITCKDVSPKEQLTQEAFNFEIIPKVGDVNAAAQLVIPPQTLVSQNYPNPFNPDTWIPFELAQDLNVTINIYNAKGQLIRVLNLGNQKAGVYVTKDKAACWDGRDNAGEKVANGVYFYTLQAGNFRATRKMVILK